MRISCVLQFLIVLILLSVCETVMDAEQLCHIPWEFQPQCMHHLIFTGSLFQENCKWITMKIEDEDNEYLERESCILDVLPLYLDLNF